MRTGLKREIEYILIPSAQVQIGNKTIAVFNAKPENTDSTTVKSFGQEWEKFNAFDEAELELIFNEYFDLCDDQVLPFAAKVLDIGCGSGRWSACLAKRVAHIDAIDPSPAIYTAARLTNKFANIRLSQCAANNLPFADNSFDFLFSLGVLHHLPNTQQAIIDCTKKLKPGGWALFYLYYALDNRGLCYKLIFRISTFARYIICRMPKFIKHFICDAIATVVYWPFVQIVKIFKKLNISFYAKLPLAYYADKSFYIMRNDALDRFGTPLEQRFTKTQILKMLQIAGLTQIQFSNKPPYWHCIAHKPNV